MTDAPKMKDSGERRTFSTGAVRDRGGFKPRPDLISPHANLREGAWLAKGAEKYGLRNYEKGMPISDCVASLTRHLEQYKRGDTDEDHAAAIRTNAGFIIHFEEEIKAGRLPADLDDMPHYDTPQLGDRRVNPETGTPEVYVELQGNDSAGDHHRLSRLVPDEAPTFYIAGPMRGYKYYNFPVFDTAARMAREKGYSVINPAELDREHGIDPVNDPNSVKRAEEADPNLVQTLAQRDCEAILNLQKDRGDGLILLPGWAKSTGARAEVALAMWLGLTFKIKLCDHNWISDRLVDIPSFDVRSQLFHQDA